MANRWWPWALGGLAAGGIVWELSRLRSIRALAPTGGEGTQLQAGDRVVLVGDSIGQGIAPFLTKVLAARGITLTSIVVKGKTAQGILPYVVAKQASLQGVKLAFVSLGSNDAALNDPTTEAPSVRALVTTLSAPTLWIVPPNFRLVSPPLPATQAKQDTVAAMFADAGLTSRIYPSDAVVAELSSADRIHLTPGGYQAYANQIAASVTSDAIA